MDAAPVEVTVETRAACADSAKARVALEEALAAARAPRRTSSRAASEGANPHWVVEVRLFREGGLGRGEALIYDDLGREVARRSVAERGQVCTPLTRALGAWASLVLDQELARAEDRPAAEPAVEARVTPYAGTGFLLPVAPPADRAAPRERARVVEVGASGSLRSGLVGTSTSAGVAPHVAFEVSPALFLRPALSFGWATDRVPVGRDGARVDYRAYGLRVDGCRRIPGNYIDRRGIELDACAGADVVLVVTSEARDVVRGSLGPSAIMRGELGAGFALEVRAAVGANVARAAHGAEERAPMLVAIGEVGVSSRWP